MPVITPPGSTPLPTPPSTANPSTFDSRADAFLAALPTYQTEQNALAANVAANATDAATSATTAATQAGTATTQAGAAAASAVTAGQSAGAAAWSAGTAYTLGQRAIDPTNGRVYRRTVAGTTGTQPNADIANWAMPDAGLLVQVVTGTTQLAVAFTHYILTNAAATTVTMPAAPVSGDTVRVTWTNGRADNVLARNGQLMGGAATDTPLDTGIRGTAEFRFVNNSWELQ